MSALGVAASRETSVQTGTPARVVMPARRILNAVMVSGWAALVLGQILGIVLGRPEFIAFRIPVAGNETMVASLGMLMIGLMSGAITGLSLRGMNSLIRLLVTVFDVLVGLVTFEIMRGVLLGMPPRDALLADSGWRQIVQFGVSLFGAWVGIHTGRATPPARLPAAPLPATSPERRSRRSRPRSRATGIRRPAVRQALMAAPSAPGGDGVRVQVPAITPHRLRVRRGRLARRKIHLGKETTDVCPYCLQEVKPNDPRGKVVCSICGTPHHADCWAITGKCEVPHLQT